MPARPPTSSGSLTRTLAIEYGKRGMRANVVCPGSIDTPMMAVLPEAARESLAQQVPFPSRLGTAAEFAALAAHIIENQMLNGEVIRLDGAIREVVSEACEASASGLSLT